MCEVWPKVALGDVTRQRRSSVLVEPGREYPLLGVRWHGEGPFLREVVTSDSSKATRLYQVQNDDFIYNRLFAYKGSFGRVPQDLAGSFVSNEFPLFTCEPGTLDPRFLELYFQQESVWSLVEQESVGTTASRSRWKEEYFASHQLALPPLATQMRIVDLMGVVDQAVSALSSEERALANLIVAVRERFFSETVPGADWVEFSKVTTDVRRPLAVEPDVAYWQIGVRSHGRGLFGKDSVTGEQLGSKKMYSVREGDLIFNVVFAWEGAVAVVPEAFDGWASSHRFPTFRRVDGGSEEFLRQFFLGRAGLESLLLASPGGAGRNRTLGRSALGRIRVPRVDLNLEETFVQAMTALEATSSRLSGELGSLKALRSCLLGALLSGSMQIGDAYDLDTSTGVSA